MGSDNHINKAYAYPREGDRGMIDVLQLAVDTMEKCTCKDDESKAAIINPYRGYIQVTPATSPVRGYTVDGEETAIEGMDIVQMENGSVYNLNGQRVENAQKGLYIVNGKKVLVK